MSELAKPADTKPFVLGLVLIDGFALMSYASVVEPLRAANLLAERPLYAVRTVVPAGEVARSSAGALVPADASLDDPPDADLLLVVAGGDPVGVRNSRLMNWLRRASRSGIALGGVSGGPVILGLAGLMAGRRMTVHWEHAPTLLELAPNLLLERSLYVIDRDRVTCAGGTAPMDLMHALIAQHHGPRFAQRVSDWFLHTEVRPAGGPQRAGLIERYGYMEAAVLDAIAAMENNIAEPLRLEDLARFAGTSVRQLNRLFQARLKRSTMAFYRDLRLEKAQSLLRGSPLGITEIALATGFASSAHFSTAYARRYGSPPSRLRKEC